MRTGKGPPNADVNTMLQGELEQRMFSLVCALVEKSLDTALFYCEKSGRKIITEHDFMYAIRYETSTFLDTTDMDARILEFYTMIKEKKLESDEESVESSDSPIDEEEFREAPDEEDPKVRQINETNRNWDNFEPTDPVKKILKDSIDKFTRKIQEEGIQMLEGF
jgi:histone H3/H4